MFYPQAIEGNMLGLGKSVLREGRAIIRDGLTCQLEADLANFTRLDSFLGLMGGSFFINKNKITDDDP